MKTLEEVIQIRQNKYNKEKQNKTYTEFWQGYMEGWYCAYKDLIEILEQNGFDSNLIVIKDSSN